MRTFLSHFTPRRMELRRHALKIAPHETPRPGRLESEALGPTKQLISLAETHGENRCLALAFVARKDERQRVMLLFFGRYVRTRVV